ncbi:hypothetical protein ACQCN2_14420 [Brevibacillus ginsengisoli]|uniref:hypothetical protein n=1 Tax=Brevibacillus ginsengisoli TaxID=363854 RepID=UPI003CE83441
MKKQASWLLVAATTVLLLQGCSSSAQPNTQPAPAPAGQTSQAVPQSGANQGTLDLTPELELNPSMKIGTTTYDELVAKFGKADEVKDHKTPFRTGLNNPQSKYPQIVNTAANFHINPLTGEKMDQAFPYFFTKDDKKVLVSSHIFLKRGDLLEKERDHTITLDDIKKVYGKPLRESPVSIEYYDFDHKIALDIMVAGKGKFGCMLTKYDLLYGSDTQDMQKHEEKIKELAAKLNQ